MARYIDADKFLKDETKRCGSVPIVGSCTTNNESLAYQLAKAPTADVEEAKHGIWVINPDGYYPYCNQCGYEPYRPLGDYDNRTPYCPNCGAKMRKEWEK